MSVLTIWDFYEFIVFTEEIPHLLLLQELLNIPHTKSELKCDESVAMDPEVDVKKLVTIFGEFLMWCFTRTHIHQYQKKFKLNLLKNKILGGLYVTFN